MTPSPQLTKEQLIDQKILGYADALKAIIKLSTDEDIARRNKEKAIHDASILEDELRALKQDILSPIV